MSSDSVLDFLTEELVVGKNIVTYRSLSHALGIHVNKAKNELASYHSERAGSLDAAHATYIIGGEPRTSYLDSVRDADAMTVDEQETDEGSEHVPETKITLVGEADLETSKEQYARIDFVHIYSLSPAPIREPALLCEPAKSLRETDKGAGTGFTVALGRITGPNWHTNIKERTDLRPARSPPDTKSSAANAASTSKNKLPGLSKAPSTTEETKPVVKSEPKDVKLEVKEEPAKPKPSGKLDFSKAKPAASDSKPKVEPAESSPASKPGPKSELQPSKPKNKLVERKSTLLKLSDSEDEESTRAPVKPPTGRTESNSAPRATRVAAISDDEDDEAPKPPPTTKAAYKKIKRKAAVPPDSDAEKELRAMMDIDDDHVTKVPRAASISEPATPPPATDVEMEDRGPETEPEPEPEPGRAPAARKAQRKPKKVVPVGRNGLRKRRVVKSRTTMDGKGYVGAS
ncbi:DNA polymerase subunit Cdc27 [Russula earlei]|uniref:DNA polymerase subunit Cdc27 n=1 Tax=Russula earlei TaxID=71964 RepID=A0ACC0UDN1_9AGAM|nr:DNA polymerase subunit Cdc27 [Russula earlei]